MEMEREEMEWILNKIKWNAIDRSKECNVM